MALDFSCPGMAFPQFALGVPSAPTIVAGGGLGGIFWSAVLRPWIAARQKRAADAATTATTKAPPATLASTFNASHISTLLVFEILLAGIVATVALKAPSAPSPLHPVTGGLVIAGAQLVSLLLRGSMLGVSTCYEQFGDWIVYLARGGGLPRRSNSEQKPSTSAMVFAASMTAGAWLLAHARPELMTLMPTTNEANLVRFFAGGFLMAVGSRMAGGCASGHGISGMALMSLSSVVTMFATFAAAICVSLIAG